MPPSRRSSFRIDWVLVDELAIGPAPRASHHLDHLEQQGLKAVLSLCSREEAPPPAQLEQRFHCERLVLPDHRSQRMPQLSELQAALTRLDLLLQQYGPVYVHCVAAMERSPLVCLGWLVQQHRQTPQAALDYLMQVHPGTNPLPGQLRLVGMLARGVPG